MKLWINWLRLVCIVVALFGAGVAVAPHLANAGFSLVLFRDSAHIAAFGNGAVSYLSLAHAVLGSTMLGWGIALFLIIQHFAMVDLQKVWKIVTISVGLWFSFDTAVSITSGFWPNAVLNTVFVMLFAVPLVALRANHFGGSQSNSQLSEPQYRQM